MLAAFTCFDLFMLLELDSMVDIYTSPSLFKIIRDQNAFKKKKKLVSVSLMIGI